MVARTDLLDAVGRNGSGYQGAVKRLPGGSSSRYRPLASRAVWRDDTGAYVLALMRRRAADGLIYLARMCRGDGNEDGDGEGFGGRVRKQRERERQAPRHYVARCYGWDDVRFKHKGALLWFREDPTSPSPSSHPPASSGAITTPLDTDPGSWAEQQKPETAPAPIPGPGPFAVFATQHQSQVPAGGVRAAAAKAAKTENAGSLLPEGGGSNSSGTAGWGPQNRVAVALHNVPALLGAAETARVVREAWPVFGGGGEGEEENDDGGFIYMLAGRRTTGLQAQLWRLQGYLADYHGLET